MALRTDYKDDILDLTQNTQRKYRMITNDDDTVSFEDVTVYSQVGDSFGAFELNQIANVVNEGSGNIDYFPDEDVIKIKDAEGVWHGWASGGLQSFDLNDLTKLSPEDWEIEYSSGATTAEVTSNPFKFAMTAGSGSTSWKAVATTTKSLNLGSFNRLVMNGTLKGYKNNPSSGSAHSISLINETTGNTDYIWEYLDGNASAGVTINESVSLSLDSTATYKIQLTLFGYPGWVPGYFQFDDFRLYKEV